MHPEVDATNDPVDRVVRAVHPLRIILFGSVVRGEMRPESDLDQLVVMSAGRWNAG